MTVSVQSDAAEYILFNIDRGLQLAGHVRMAGDSASRRKGLLGVDSLGRDAGLWIVPCEAIHTFGMQMPIDVLFLDRDFNVKKLRQGLAPYRISLCFSASSVVEMRAGAISESQTKVGDRLMLQRVGGDFGMPAREAIRASTCPPS